MAHNKDIENLIKKFSKEASQPDPVFRYQLKQEVLKEFNKQSLFEKFFGHLNRLQFGLLSFSASGLTLIAIAILFFSIYGGKNIINTGELGQALNEQDKTAVMRKIFTANPGSQISPESTLSGQGFQTTDINNINLDPARNNSSNSLYDHQTLIQSYQSGTKIQSCKTFTDLPLVAKV